MLPFVPDGMMTDRVQCAAKAPHLACLKQSIIYIPTMTLDKIHQSQHAWLGSGLNSSMLSRVQSTY